MAVIDVVSAPLSPLRGAVLAELREPASASEVAGRLGETRQRVNYHVRALERGGLVELVEERARRGCTERVVRATADAVVVEPTVIGSPAAVCAANGMPGCRMPGTWPSSAAAGATGARMSASGTAYEGQTRRGSQTSTARVLSTTA
jgi:DNA-binding transcriptional ArsR family regulator